MSELIQILQPMPAFGAPGVCLDYDDDCFTMSQPLRIKCWSFGAYFISSERNKAYGELHDQVCPFMD